MSRTTKPAPRQKRDVRHGCVDCTHYPLPCSKEPCKSCDYYSNWVDKREAESHA